MSSRKHTSSCINGLYVSQAKQIAERYFLSNFEKIINNASEFHIYIKDSVDENKIDGFLDMWPEFIIFKCTYTKYKKTKTK